MDLKQIADQVVRKYFELGEGDLGDVITGFAQQYDLNNQEICRVAERANTKVFLKLYEATKDKTTEFDVADPREIVRNIGKEEVEVDFDDSYFEIEVEKEIPSFEEMLTPEKTRGQGLKNLLLNLINEKEDVEIKIMEMKRPLKRKIIKKAKLYSPQEVLQATNSELVKEAYAERKIEIDSEKDVKSNRVESDLHFLNKIATYGKLFTRLEEIEEKLEKIASIFNASKNVLGKGVKGVQTFGKVTDLGRKTNNYKAILNDPNPTKADFNDSKKPKL